MPVSKVPLGSCDTSEPKPYLIRCQSVRWPKRLEESSVDFLMFSSQTQLLHKMMSRVGHGIRRVCVACIATSARDFFESAFLNKPTKHSHVNISDEYRNRERGTADIGGREAAASQPPI